MTLRGDLPLTNLDLIDEDETRADEDNISIEEQISLSSYRASNLFVSSAYSKIPAHAQPVFSRRVLVFVWSTLALKPLVLVALYIYAIDSGRHVAVSCVAAATLGYYAIWAVRAALLYFNIKRDRLPLSPALFWIISACLGSLSMVSLSAAAYETFSADGVFALVTRGQSRPLLDPLRSRTLAVACGATAALWLSTADSFAAAANFFLARFWTRAVLNSPVAF
uniref:Integral membrane protein UL20 n=1 Tax=Bovine alphaherpesvirus 2 TaxID=10295 RepID=Q98WK1_9ALPH|nr:integral membrane protein UL20 [Bovine alphaherpesvirus 2]